MDAPPAFLKTSEFMLQLHKQLVEVKKLADTTATLYVRQLYTLNDKKPFKNLAFLKDTEAIQRLIGTNYATSTQKTIFSTITSVLDLYKEKSGYKKVYDFYYEQMMEKAKAAAEVKPEEKTEKQEENWITWEEVEKHAKELREKVAVAAKEKTLSPAQFETLLHTVVLGLYTYTPPRRNQDYLDMKIVRVGKKDVPEQLPKEKNYLVLSPLPTKFVFNKYKTSKTYGQQLATIPPMLAEALTLYIKHHPGLKDKKVKEAPFLVDTAGSAITAGNAITRILNKVFGKAIGSSMLRHIYLSSKYNITEMAADATAMAHSVAQQKEYLKASEAPSPPSASPAPPSSPSTSHSHPQTEAPPVPETEASPTLILSELPPKAPRSKTRRTVAKPSKPCPVAPCDTQPAPPQLPS